VMLANANECQSQSSNFWTFLSCKHDDGEAARSQDSKICRLNSRTRD